MSRDFDKAQEMVVASMEYVKVLGFRIRRTEVQRDDWKKVALFHADEVIKLRQRVDELKAERDALRSTTIDTAAGRLLDAFGSLTNEPRNGAPDDEYRDRIVNKIHSIKMERDALRAECDDLRRVFSLVHGSLGIQQGEHIGNAIDALKKERDDLTTRLRQSIARGDFAEMRAATLLAELAEQKPSFDPTVAKMESAAEASHITPEGKQTAEGALPQPGDVVRLVREPSADTVGDTLKNSLDWPWESRWGCVGDRGEIVESVGKKPGARSVRIMNTGVKVWWPLSCIEVVKGVDK